MSPCALMCSMSCEDHRHLVHAHAGGGLVEHEDVGLEREQDRHLELALVAVRQRGGDERALVGERHAMQAMLGLLDELDVPAPHRPGVAPEPRARLHREAHVLQHREAREEVGELEGAADAAVRALRGARAAVMSSPNSETRPSLACSCPEIRLK